MQWIVNNSQFLIFAVVILFSILGTVGKKLKEKQDERQVSMERRRREAERLRTGRVEEPNEPDQASAAAERQRRLDQLAESRRRQLEELRRRRAAAAAGTAAPSTATTQTPTAAPAPPRPAPRPAQRPTPSRPPQQAPARSPAPRPRPTPQSRPTPTPAQRAQQRQERASLSRAPELANTPKKRPVAETPAPSRRPGAVSSRGDAAERTMPAPAGQLGTLSSLRGLSRAELRRAIILTEVLAPPVSERPQSA